MVAKTSRQFFLVLFCALLLDANAQQVKEPTSSTAGLEDAFWSLSIQDASTGEELVGIRSHHLMTPASTMKIVSTATAMSIYPASKRFETRILTEGLINGDTLEGNIYLVGDGDPSIGSRYFWKEDPNRFFKEVASALKAKGIRKVNGGVMAFSDKTDFQAESPRWPLYDLGNHYAAGAYGLNLFDNAYTVNITNYGQSLRVEPNIPDLKLTSLFERTTTRSRDSLYISRLPLEDGSYAITGVYPASIKSVMIRGAIPNPPLFMAQHLQKYLSGNGISFGTEANTVSVIPTSMDLLYTFRSPTIRDLASITNVYSHNLFAEGFLRLVGQGKQAMPGHNRMQTSVMEVMKYWSSRGMDTRELEMYDGSGLSAENKVSAYFLATLLGKVHRAEPSGTFMYTLPRAGKEGTLASFLKRTPLEGHAYLKSGTIRNVVCYAGYVQLNGKTYSLAIMVNNYYGRATNIRRILEDVLLESFGL